MIEFTRITPEKQNEILDKKLQNRLELSLLTNNDSPNYQINRQIAYDLCKGNISIANLDRKLSEGFVYWCDNFAWIQNPRAETLEEKNIPFLLWDYQETAAEEIIRAILLGYDLPIEKSRDLGLSWLLIAIFVWGWNFHGWDLLVGGQKAENVDTKGNIKSLLEKARYICERSPTWLIPDISDKNFNKKMLLKHPKNGASLAGESNNTNFGRSDRRKAILFDEYTSWEQTDRAAWQSCSSTTRCRLPLSTPNTRGTNCHHYTVINNAKKKLLPFLRIHWSLHPIYGDGLYEDELGKLRSPWYDDEVKRAPTINEVYQELDIDYDASMGDKIFPNFNIETNVNDNVDYNPNLPLYVSADFGLDTTAFLWWQYDYRTNTHYVIDEYQSDGKSDGTSIYHYIDVLQSKPYKKPIMYGDPYSGENNSLTSGQSNAKILRKYGYIFKSQRAKKVARIAAARNMMDKVVISGNCILLIESLISWQFLKPKTGNVSSQVPKHDEYSHIGDAFTYYCFNISIRNHNNNSNKNKNRYTTNLSGVNL